ncbi:STN domain-containing protein, partial [Delftia tsuruhatensis]
MPHPVPGALVRFRPPAQAPALAPAFARTVLAMALQACAVGGLSATAAHAQTMAAPAAAQRFDLPAAPLDRALNAFATQAGILLTADGSLTAGKTGAALHGSYSVREGLAALLAGSGLEAVPQAG